MTAKYTTVDTSVNDYNEGEVRFDSLFYFGAENEDIFRREILLNLESQNYSMKPQLLFNRAIFQISRMISSEKNRDFTGNHFEDLLNCYSIWIILNQAKTSFI